MLVKGICEKHDKRELSRYFMSFNEMPTLERIVFQTKKFESVCFFEASNYIKTMTVFVVASY